MRLHVVSTAILEKQSVQQYTRSKPFTPVELQSKLTWDWEMIRNLQNKRNSLEKMILSKNWTCWLEVCIWGFHDTRFLSDYLTDLHAGKSKKDICQQQSPTCKVVHETNKAHFRNLLPSRFLPSSVGRALEWWSGGPRFQPTGDEFWQFFLLFPV